CSRCVASSQVGCSCCWAGGGGSEDLSACIMPRRRASMACKLLCGGAFSSGECDDISSSLEAVRKGDRTPGYLKRLPQWMQQRLPMRLCLPQCPQAGIRSVSGSAHLLQ